GLSARRTSRSEIGERVPQRARQMLAGGGLEGRVVAIAQGIDEGPVLRALGGEPVPPGVEAALHQRAGNLDADTVVERHQHVVAAEFNDASVQAAVEVEPLRMAGKRLGALLAALQLVEEGD